MRNFSEIINPFPSLQFHIAEWSAPLSFLCYAKLYTPLEIGFGFIRSKSPGTRYVRFCMIDLVDEFVIESIHPFI